MRASQQPDYYAALSVLRSASAEEIRSAYRVIARRDHPDKNPGDADAAERYRRAAEAYRVLSDEHLRQRYDRGDDTQLLGAAAAGEVVARRFDQLITQALHHPVPKHGGRDTP
ncbi:J domain-containing protein [Candidatus Uhrbacteria bacterium]|nr:J domain-containing protein [Candidatus Uhrbacteria bacterium]